MKSLSDFKLKYVLLLFVAVVFLCAGCSKDKGNLPVKQLKIIRGSEQCALPGEKFKKKLIIEVLGPKERGLLGGKGQSTPLANQKVLFQAIDGSDLKLSAQEGTTNSGGEVMLEVEAGKSLGDQYLKVIPVQNPEASLTVRFVTGVKIIGDDQEAHAGKKLPHPISIQALDQNGKPLKDVPVFFNVCESPDGKSSSTGLGSERVLTNDDGIASTTFKVGSKTGVYGIEATVADKERNIFIRGIRMDAMSINIFDLIITVIGGLALFVLGMKMMSDGLQVIAGENMRRILQFFASNRIVAVLAGTGVTAVIQSSSACSVMVIGFINAGLLKLSQAIGIVLGADIGTTVTAQIISFKLGQLALPAIIIGTLAAMLISNKIGRGWGTTVLGFGLLFFGMGMMGDELKAIGNFPTFVSFFNSFDCNPVSGTYMPVAPVLGAFGIGILLTVVIQSSSASIGIIMALAGSGLINFYTAMPLMLGANVGTTITAVIASIPTNKRGKQVALAHVLTKAFGTSYMIALFYVDWPGTDVPIFMYVVNYLTAGNVFAAVPQNVMRHVANAHTLFNIVNVLVLIPLIGVMEKVCNILIPVRDEKLLKITYLEPHLLDTPSVALEQVIQSIRYMVKESWSMVNCAMDDHFFKGSVDKDKANDLEEREFKIDDLQNEVTSYLVKLTRRELSTPQAEIIPLLMHCTNDAERIADHTENILGLAKRLKKADCGISEIGSEELNEIWTLLSDEAQNVIGALNNRNPEGAAIAIKDEKKINKLVNKFEKNHVKRLSGGDCNPVSGIIFIEIMAELEKIGDHLCNIAERNPEIQKHYFEIG
ncbi:MAG: hypothetical protein GY750_10865 [Lentisphaerae bacterium]|nr:hypothetical protein [Lentisphaerota bacterium]MCP4101912.1 hypothetical protein [Lentisphaerota bacterium]